MKLFGAQKKSELTGVVGALPGIPAESHVKPKHIKKSIEREKLLSRYDKAFAELLSRHVERSRRESLERLKRLLYELSPELKAWSGDVRLRAYLLMQEIRKGLDDPTTAGASLGLLVLILSKGGRSAAEMARPLFHEKIAEMYRKPTYDNERFLPRLLLLLDDYDPAIVESLARDAIHLWGDEQFRAASDYLGFEELKERGLRGKVKSLLGSEIAEAGVNGDRTALDRAVELYHAVT